MGVVTLTADPHSLVSIDHLTTIRLTPRAGAVATTELSQAPQAPDPSTAEVRAWARAAGLAVPGKGRLRPEIWDAWRTAHPDPGTREEWSP